ncbi:MAG: hypothetical protein H6492_00300 [Candidatus Paracaedibacteraceae bacterium]|nr:hypothetical protein [Candidatus Paracaedibacteraceae bacterium]
MQNPQKFNDYCQGAKKYILNSPLFNDIYIGVFRSLDGVPEFYACNNPVWMKEYIEKELWFVDPIVKEGLLLNDPDKETLLSWGSKMSENDFFKYRDAYIGPVKGFSKIFKHYLPTGSETVVIGIGLYPEHISPDKPLNVNAIFREAEEKIKKFTSP